MAIYYPSIYCDINSKLKLKKQLNVEYADGRNMTFHSGEEFIVDEIIGYGYNLKPLNLDFDVIRIKLNSIEEYFEPINLISYNYKDEIPDIYDSLPIVRFKKTFTIEDVVEILETVEFKHEKSITDKIFHNLYSIAENRLFIRLKNEEFEKYIE